MKLESKEWIAGIVLTMLVGIQWCQKIQNNSTKKTTHDVQNKGFDILTYKNAKNEP